MLRVQNASPFFGFVRRTVLAENNNLEEFRRDDREVSNLKITVSYFCFISTRQSPRYR